MRFLPCHLAAAAIAGAGAASAQQTAAITATPTTPSASVLPTPELVEIDVVFPRWNETYAKTKLFPIVLSVQNFPAL